MKSLQQLDQAQAETERAIALDPNWAESYIWLADVLSFAGKPEEAVKLVERAMRLNPKYPVNYLGQLAFAYGLMGQYREAIPLLQEALRRNPNYLAARVISACFYSELGQEEEARSEMAKAVAQSPNLSVEGWRQRLPFKDPKVLEHWLAALRKAGLK
jgi:adenylate cyclase